jgi:hypothetical protein
MHEGKTQIGKAIVLILVAVVIAVVVLHHVGSSGVASSIGTRATTTTTVPLKHKAPPKKKKQVVKPLIAPAKIKVQVLNGLLTGTLAGNLSASLKGSPGYDTLPANNTTVRTTTSVVYMVTRGYYREARALAKVLGLTGQSVKRTIPASAPIPAGIKSQANLIVIIGTSLQSKAGAA